MEDKNIPWNEREKQEILNPWSLVDHDKERVKQQDTEK